MTYSVKSKQNAIIYNHLEAHCRENESRPLNFNAFSALGEEGFWPRLKQGSVSNTIVHAPPPPNSLCLPTFVETNWKNDLAVKCCHQSGSSPKHRRWQQRSGSCPAPTPISLLNNSMLSWKPAPPQQGWEQIFIGVSSPLRLLSCTPIHLC